MTQQTFWCERAVVGASTTGLSSGVLIEVEAGRITAITTDVECPATAERLGGVTLPGFANGHSHAFHRALRGRTHTGEGSFWTWREQMYRVAAVLDPDTYRALARAVFGEMVLGGFTVVGEFHYLHHGPDGIPYADDNEMGEVLASAAAEAGVRMTLLDTCYLSSGFGAPPDRVQRRFSDGSVDRWVDRFDRLERRASGAAMLRVGAAVHSVRAVDPVAIAAVADRAQASAAPLHAHVSEQPAENEGCLSAHGTTPVGVFVGAGAVDERFTAVHATHLSASDVTALGAARCTCCFCPTTERDLADGVGPSVELLAAGAQLSIGTDSHAQIDPFEEMRGLELDTRLVTLRRGNIQPVNLLRIGSADGYRSLGWTDGGVIAVGALADFVTVSTESVRTAGTVDGDAGGLLFAASAADVRCVVVDGVVRVRDGRHVEIDVGHELAAAIARIDERGS